MELLSNNSKFILICSHYFSLLRLCIWQLIISNSNTTVRNTKSRKSNKCSIIQISHLFGSELASQYFACCRRTSDGRRRRRSFTYHQYLRTFSHVGACGIFVSSLFLWIIKNIIIFVLLIELVNALRLSRNI